MQLGKISAIQKSLVFTMYMALMALMALNSLLTHTILKKTIRILLYTYIGYM